MNERVTSSLVIHSFILQQISKMADFLKEEELQLDDD